MQVGNPYLNAEIRIIIFLGNLRKMWILEKILLLEPYNSLSYIYVLFLNTI